MQVAGAVKAAHPALGFSKKLNLGYGLKIISNFVQVVENPAEGCHKNDITGPMRIYTSRNLGCSKIE